jgi:hypothetical protein
MAYSISNLNGAEPSVEYLNEMENKQYKNVQRKVLKRSSQKESKLKIYNQGNDEDMNEEENELLGSYVTLTPKVRGNDINLAVSFFSLLSLFYCDRLHY